MQSMSDTNTAPDFDDEPTRELKLTPEELELHAGFMALGRTRTTARDLRERAAAATAASIG